MKTNNQTATANTQTALENLMQERNKMIDFLNCHFDDFASINAEIMQTLSEIAAYKTLKFLMSNNATNNTATETTENGTVNTYGYNMALTLFNNLYNDIAILNNAEILTDILTDGADLIQQAILTLTPFFNSPVQFSLTDTIYTKQCKNGNLKNYTAFQLACKSIRDYITAQDKKQYKKIAYCIGYTDNGTEILTTKRPKNDITDISTETKTAFIKQYRLTDMEQTALLYKLNGYNTTATANILNVSKRTIERALSSARQKIALADNRIKL